MHGTLPPKRLPFARRLRGKLRQGFDWLAEDAVLSLYERAPRVATKVYALSPAFEREHRAVLHGRLTHRKTNAGRTGVGARYMLRRNIHRLEKGLIMRPRREVFARDYILETVEVYCALAAEPGGVGTRELLGWAHDVLARYFSVVSGDRDVDKAAERFRGARSAAESDDETLARKSETRSPYRRPADPCPVTYDALLELAVRRRSVRWYRQEPVPREVIDRALRVALYSPSACNRQPFEFLIFDRPADARAIGAIPMGTTGFSDNFVALAVIVGDLSAYPHERDRHVIYVDGGLAAMAFQFGLEVQGVASCCINWPDIEARERAMAKALRLTPEKRPLMLISFGYPDTDGEVPFSQKKTLAEVRRYGDESST